MARSADEEAVQGISDKKARKEAYYTRQRQNAKMGSAEKGKIEGKLNFGDEARGFAKDQYQKVMASGPWSIPGGKAAEAVEGAVGGAAKAIGSGARGLAKRAGSAIESEVQHLRTPTPVKKALGSSKPALTTVKQSAKGKAAADARRAAGKPDHWFQEKSKPQEPSKRKALGTSGQWQYEKELAGQSAKKVPKAPKTFNRNGTKRAEGRQKSTRNPVSKRKSVNG
jgi:hypothetical protein